MIHVVFNTADVDKLKEAIALDETLEGAIVEIKDEYAVGPIADMYTEEGAAARKNWWRQVLEIDETAEDQSILEAVNDQRTIGELRNQLKEEEELECWIWMGQNKHDVCGYYWMLPYIQEFQGRVQVLYMNNLPFINEKGGIFYPSWLSEIPAKEFLKAKKLARPITLSEFEIDPDEWKKLCDENAEVRLLEGGKKIASKSADFYDSNLCKYVSAEWMKASKVIHQFLGKEKETTGDTFLLWRLKTMLAEGKFETQGDPMKKKDFEIKWPSKA